MGELGSYREKRDFARSPEPSGADSPDGERQPRRFVVQKHAARRTHFDLRLEVSDTLKSWAVPKGPSANPETKRLAVEVEDHPLDYAKFEGVIPEGQYGAGAVIIWDRGRFEPVGLSEDSDTAIENALAEGKLEFKLLGERLRGRWALVRMKGRDGENNWLLLKKRDAYAEPGDPDALVERFVDSVISGRDLVEQAAQAEAGEEDRERPPVDVSPMLAQRSNESPRGEAWCFELKVDGIRAIGWARPSGLVRIYSRRGQRLERPFPEVSDALELLARRTGSEFVLDGEITTAVPDGAARFEDLQPRFNLSDPIEIAHWSRKRPAELHAFDLLWIDGVDLRDQPLSERKDRLRRLLRSAGHGLHYTPHDIGNGTAMTQRARREGWEGVVAKRLKSRYLSGQRTRDWLKLKNVESQEFLVCGWTEPQGSRKGFGALVLGYYDREAEGRPLRCAGRVGSGFGEEDLQRLAEQLMELEQEASPFDDDDGAVPPDLQDAHWTRPQLVAQVNFQEWTKDGRLRQPVFVGLRTDVEPTAVVREQTTREEQGPPVEPTPDQRALIDALHNLESEGGEGELMVDGRPLRLTNLDKIFWPDSDLTKGDLLRYYASVAPAILPALADRPLVLERYPDGIDGEMFYQQRAPDPAPDGVRIVTVDSEEENPERLVAGDLYTLLYTTQLAAISQHVWPSRIGSLDHADYTVLDLDPPPDLPFSDVREVARTAGDELHRLGLRGYPKTSGGAGIHIVIPLTPNTTYESARLLAELVARLTNRALPEITTLQRATAKRGRRIYLDYLQNRKGKTIASVYSVRPRPGAPVSTPLRWSELDRDLQPDEFTLRSISARLQDVGDLWAACRSDANDIREVVELL